jgi:phage-related protein
MAIDAKFTADFSQWKTAVDAAQGDIEQLTVATEKITPAVGLLAAQVGTQIRQLGSDIGALGKEYGAAYAEEEAATQKLIASLTAQGTATTGVISQYQAMADQFQKTTTFAGEAVLRSEAIFTSIGKVGPEQMQAALDAAANLATFMGTDMETAATMMAKAFGSGGESLGKLKTILGEAAPETADFASIVEALNKQFGGQAAAAMETTSGKIANLENQFGEIKETVGGLIVQGLTPLLNFFTSLPEPVQTTIAAVAILGTALAPIAVAFAALVTAAAPLVALLGGTAGITALLGAAGAALAAIAAPVAIAVAAIGSVYLAFKYWDQITAFVAGVYNAVKTYLVDKFNALLGSIRGAVDSVTGFFQNMYDKVVGHSYVPDMINGIGQQFGRLDSVMTQPAKDAASATEAALKAASDAWLASPFNRMARNAMTILTDSGGVAHDAYGNPVAGQGEINALPRSLGHQNIQIAVYGSVLSTQHELSTLVQDAMMQSYRSGGNRVPV